MKKFMIAAAVVCVAAISQGASIIWGNSGSSSGIYGLDGTTKLTSTVAGNNNFSITLMLIGGGVDGADLAVQTLSGKSAINTMTAGSLSGATWDYTYGSDAKNADAFYILATMTVDGKNYEMTINPSPNAIAATDNTGKDTFTWAAGTYGGLSETATVGKWSAAAVPEPTSGLLLLLGVAGLALKRKRA